MDSKQFKALMLVAILTSSIGRAITESVNIYGYTSDETINSMQPALAISASTDFMNMNTIPIIAQINKPITISCTLGQFEDEDYLQITGEQGTVLGEISMTSDKQDYTFIPEEILNKGPVIIRGGTYRLQVYNKEQKCVRAQRKLYLNASNNQEGYQMSDIQIDRTNGLTIGFNVLSTYQGTAKNYIEPTQGIIRIEENGVWSRTIKNEVSRIPYFEILENKDFILNSGNYQIVAGIKTPSSIELENSRVSSYYNSYVDQQASNKAHKLNVEIKEITQEGETNRKFKVIASCSDCNDLVVNFLVKDDLGIQEVSSMSYEDYSEFEFERERKYFDYDLIARVRHKNAMYKIKGIVLPASYEAETRVKVEREKEEESIILESISVTPSSIEQYYESTQNVAQAGLGKIQDVKLANGEGGAVIAGVNVNNKNYIHVNAYTEDAGLKNNAALYYRAWVVDGGVVTTLGEYSTSPDFVYCPRSGININNIENKTGNSPKLVVIVQYRDENNKIISQTMGSIRLEYMNSRE